MLLKDHQDLKAAIIAIPAREKDKLLLRLIAKDKVLTEHLHFKLLEDLSDLEYRRQCLMEEIDELVSELGRMKKQGSKEALVVFRKLNGRVNHHFKVTRDAGTEVEVRLYLLKMIPLAYHESTFSPLAKFNERLRTYYLRTGLALYKKYRKLHEELQFDLKEGVSFFLLKIKECGLGKAAQEIGLPEEL